MTSYRITGTTSLHLSERMHNRPQDLNLRPSVEDIDLDAEETMKYVNGATFGI